MYIEGVANLFKEERGGRKGKCQRNDRDGGQKHEKD